jgi:superfamily I DNA and/or RNA helicase
VLNLISALLNGPCPQPGAWKSSGIAVHVGSSLSKSKGGSNSPSKCIVGNVKTRILVCAPSNIAVDDLACRIHESCIGPSGRVGGFILVRFGLLPGEERTEQGRKRTFQSTGTNNYRRTNSRENSNIRTKRDEFLCGINLDLIAKSSVEKRNILANAHVVCTTLNSSGSKSFIDASLRDDSASEYDVVIIDEACQASEPSSLIPFKFNPKAVILVGDPKQLPVTIRSQTAEQANLGRSLFQRLHSFGWPVEMLRIQYRMRPEIVQFPSNQFYDGQLITPSVPFPHMPWHSSPCLPPFLLWNVRNATMTRSATGGICNHVEKKFIIFGILSALEKVMFPYSTGKHVVEVGIISFYNDQVSLIKSSLAETTSKNKKLRIQVSTVDGFQGSEKDIIILSCVRARGGGKRRTTYKI